MLLECELYSDWVLFISNPQVPKTETCSTHLLNALSQKYRRCFKVIFSIQANVFSDSSSDINFTLLTFLLFEPRFYRFNS